MKNAPSIRVLVADDYSILREGLVAVINRQPDMKVVAQARNWDELVALAVSKRPKVLVLDLHVESGQTRKGLATLREKLPSLRTIIFSAFARPEEVRAAFGAAVKGYVVKGESGRESLLTCIRAVSAGREWLHPIAAARLAEGERAPCLTPREIEVLRLLAEGKANRQIAKSLRITEGTVKIHVNHLMTKLGVSGRLEASVVAAQRGFVHPLEATHGGRWG